VPSPRARTAQHATCALAPAHSLTPRGALADTGLSCFLDAAAFATVVFLPAGLPVDVGIQHALLGFVLMQSVVCATSPVGTIVTPVSYEVMPFLARFAAGARKAMPAGAPAGALLSTVLAGSVLVSAVSAVACALLARLPLGGSLERLLPPALQAGLFAAIGWGLYTLSFETLMLEGMPFSPALLTWETAKLWVPAHVLGLGLWLASRHTSHPALFPGFVLGVAALTHAVRLYTQTSLAEAQASHWLMGAIAGRPCTTLWAAVYDLPAVQWSVIGRADLLKELLCAVLFGPLINTLLNLLLIGPVIEASVALPSELRAMAAGSAATALGGGYSNYIAVSNTAIHRKCGGRDRASCVCAAAVAGLFFAVHPLFVVVGYVPTLVVAAICVYIGADFLYDNLVDALRTNGLGASLASWAVLATCLLQDMLVGVVLGVTAFQLFALLAPKQPAAAEEKKAQ